MPRGYVTLTPVPDWRAPAAQGPGRLPSSVRRPPTGKRRRLARMAELQKLSRQGIDPTDRNTWPAELRVAWDDHTTWQLETYTTGNIGTDA